MNGLVERPEDQRENVSLIRQYLSSHNEAKVVNEGKNMTVSSVWSMTRSVRECVDVARQAVYRRELEDDREVE